MERRASRAKGASYPSLRAAARAHAIDPGTVRSRIKIGWSVERALTTPAGAQSAGSPIIVERTRFASIGQAAKHFWIPPQVARRRLRQGWTLKRAVTVPVGFVPGHRVIVRGKEYPSIAHAAAAHGVKLVTARDRIKRGWEVDEAVSQKAARFGKKRVPVVVEGRKFESLRQAAAELGVTLSTLCELRSSGLSTRRALTELLGRQKDRSVRNARRRKIEATLPREGYLAAGRLVLRGKRYSDLAAVARAFAIPYPTVKNRLRLGWDLDQAVGITQRPRILKNRRSVTVGGQSFPSMLAAARYFKVKESVARYRLQSGHTPEQAFGLEPFVPTKLKRGKG